MGIDRLSKVTPRRDYKFLEKITTRREISLFHDSFDPKLGLNYVSTMLLNYTGFILLVVQHVSMKVIHVIQLL